MLIEQKDNSKNSSVIKNFSFNFATNTLKVHFHSGAVYEYTGVTKSVYESLCEAESYGKYFTENIKNNYQHSKLLLD